MESIFHYFERAFIEENNNFSFLEGEDPTLKFNQILIPR